LRLQLGRARVRGFVGGRSRSLRLRPGRRALIVQRLPRGVGRGRVGGLHRQRRSGFGGAGRGVGGGRSGGVGGVARQLLPRFLHRRALGFELLRGGRLPQLGSLGGSLGGGGLGFGLGGGLGGGGLLLSL
jgi:hypothetical protein